MNPLFAFSGFLNFAVSVIFGVIVYLNGRGKMENRRFVLFSFSVAFWSFGYYFWQIAANPEDALFWCRFLMAGAILIPIFYFHFIVDFLNQSRKKIIFFGYILALFFLIANATSYFVEKVEPRMMFDFWPVPGILYPFFLAMFFCYVAYGWYLMIHPLASIKQKDRRQQIKYLLIGTATGFFGGSTNYLLWYNIQIPPYGNFLVIFYVIFAALAVLKYHLFEVRLVLTELLVGIMGLVLLALPFLMPTIELKLLTIFILLLFCFFGYYLIRATQQESQRREEAELVAVKEHELREEAETLAANLKHLDEAKTQFLLSTQHHLRSPLSVVYGYLSMVSEGSYGKVSAKVKEKIDVSLEATKELIGLVNELLDMARFQMNKNVAVKEQINIESLVRETAANLSPLAKEKKINLEFNGPAASLPPVAVDPKGVREAVYNIIDNAIKYTQKGGVTVSLARADNKIMISVVDTGIGMDKNEQENIFSKTFERGKDARAFNATGKGIGLYLAAQMIAANGGIIRAESEGRGRGSTFIIELPLAPANVATPPINATNN